MGLMNRRVVVIRHGDNPPDDRVHTWLTMNGFAVDLRRPYAGEALGKVDMDVAGTVLHGGPYNAADLDQHPFMQDEDRWIGDCLKADIPMLGICQGALQIAHHLGAETGPIDGEPYEFGYYRLDPADGAGDFLDRPRWFSQVHFHMFGIPNGAERLAGSDVFVNQAFRYGRKVYGLQFHPEVTIEGFRRWQAETWSPYGKPGSQTREEQDRLMYEHDKAQADWFYGFMDGLFGMPETA